MVVAPNSDLTGIGGEGCEGSSRKEADIKFEVSASQKRFRMGEQEGLREGGNLKARDYAL